MLTTHHSPPPPKNTKALPPMLGLQSKKPMCQAPEQPLRRFRKAATVSVPKVGCRQIRGIRSHAEGPSPRPFEASPAYQMPFHHDYVQRGKRKSAASDSKACGSCGDPCSDNQFPTTPTVSKLGHQDDSLYVVWKWEWQFWGAGAWVGVDLPDWGCPPCGMPSDHAFWLPESVVLSKILPKGPN